ncbi:unnamed protein product [Acanthoscelides obtectus]|uniref:CHK kinase-like domain-containing protein n=1 Tax=Acanthoscelides obtectus TaxID=200917 RepID=A0A9P0KW40_ACAOB|nr:unnamed protein product [Acanthoscelides obtectus]CAK1633726.1 hypothetical protein AOBTE_LOCUS8346 [Acanthoscelides obtectus]
MDEDALLEVSSHLTVETIQEIVKTISGCKNVKINLLETDSGGTRKGDSYLGVIYRFLVASTGEMEDGEKKDMQSHIIVKGFPKNKTRQRTFRSADFFETEIIFYEKVWPILKTLKVSKNIPEPDEVPQMLACFCNGADDFVAMLDISYDGYKSISRQDKITRQHISLLLKLLAHFHALSIAAKDQVPGFVDVAASLKETYFEDRLKDWYNGFLQNKMYYVIRHAVEQELGDHYVGKVDKFFQRDLYGDLCKLVKRQSKLSVVTEGDSWLPNFLVKENEKGVPENAVLIDFQLARYATLTNDLIHFLFAGVPEQLESNWDELIEEYYRYLSTRIEELGTGKYKRRY